MSSAADTTLSALQATALTARCHNPFFRQKQLKLLHDVLRNNNTAIQNAIRQDSRVSPEEAALEVALALDIVKQHYESIHPQQDLEEEYRVANGKNAADKRDPWGVVYVEPLERHTPFFSLVSVLAAAVAAGNCVVVKLENNLHTLPSLLRTLLPQALESDTFAIVSSRPSTEILAQCLQVMQDGRSSFQLTYSQLVSQGGRVIAIVDRTADLVTAAQHLVAARFAFGGTSPYAPDLILVNEYVRKDFSELVLKNTIRYLAGANEMPNGNGSTIGGAQKKASRVTEALDSVTKNKNWKTSVITQGDNGAIIELSDITSLPSKLQYPIFCISAITSLEHAIGMIDESLEPQERLAAAYHFGTPAGGKYLSQFVNADVSFVNHIPYRLLLGPESPAFHIIDVQNRYNAQHFSRPAPAFISASPPASNADIQCVLSSHDSSLKKANQMLHVATQEIKEGKRPEWVATGFFEQGIMIGLGVYGVPLLACIGASVFYGVGWGLRRLQVL